jgi:hypothetical protein
MLLLEDVVKVIMPRGGLEGNFVHGCGQLLNRLRTWTITGSMMSRLQEIIPPE